MFRKLAKGFLIGMLLGQASFGALPPTQVKGQSDTSGKVKFTFQAPFYQQTDLGGVNALIETGNTNILKDPGFESSTATTNWTASGGATTAVTTTTANVGSGKQAYDWDSNSASQTLTSSLTTLPAGLYGRNGEVSCNFKCASGTCTHTIGFWDGSTLSNPQTITSSSNYQRTTVNLVFPSSGSAGIRITSVASNEPELFIDDCYIGEARNVTTGQIMTLWTAYTPTFSGFGSVTGVSFFSRRVGPNLEILGRFTSGTVAASTASITLGYGGVNGNVTVDSTVLANAAVVGTWGTTSVGTGYNNIWPIATGGNNTINFGQQAAGTANLTALNGSAIFSNTQVIEVYANVPISQFNEQPFYRPDNYAISWSGYHNAISGGCSTASATFADPSACTSIALTELTNRNMGTVSTAGSSLPGISFNPPRAGRYMVCAQPMLSNSSAGADQSTRLVDGSGNQIVQSVSQSTSTANNATAQSTLCGIYNATSTSSVTIKIQMATGSGTLKIATAIQGGGTVANINWTIVALDTAYPAPVFLGSVTSNSTTTSERLERIQFGTTSAKTVCSASPCSYINQSGSWVSSVTRNSIGNYTVNIASGIFSATPTCTCKPYASGNNMICQGTSTADSSTSITLSTVTLSGPANADAYVDLICMGPRN